MKQLFFYILFLFVALAGCVDDHEDGNYPSPTKEGEVKVPFSINMPAQMPKTYALDENDENEVKTIDILAFKVNGNDETFAYRAQAEQGSIVDDGANNKKKFIVTLKKDGTQTYRFVALANAKDELDNIFVGGITVGTSKDVVMQQLQLTGVNKWNVNNGTEGYLPIPMWGETTNNIVIQDNTTITDLKLLRMVGKINVKIDPSITESTFALSSVSLYNYYTAGRIAPDQANLVSGSRSTVDKPTVIGVTTKGPIDYEGSGIVANNSILNNIYTFESVVPKNQSEVDMSKVTTLVVGGKYNGAATVSYYRVDIANGKNYLDILRNHLYTINITKVKSAGYSTKEEAFNSRPINIEAEVVVWDEAAIGNIEFDGQFMLAVSQGKFDFTKSVYNAYSDGNTVKITTDYKSNDGSVQGWKVSSIVDDSGNPITDWLTTSVSSGNAGVTTNMQIFLIENNSGQQRKGYIHISAGRLTYVIEVNQNLVPPLSLIIKDVVNGEEIGELIFVSQTANEVPTAQQFTASWMPISVESDLSSTGLAGSPFSFYTGSDTPGQGTFIKTTANGTGKQTYTIRPTAFTQTEINNNPLIEKSSKIDFLVSNGVNFKSKTIYLRQIRYGLKATLKDYYILDGTQQSLNIKSNSLWKVKSITDSQNLLASFDAGQNGGYNVQTGDTFLFTLKQVTTATDVGASITFTFYDPSGKYADVNVTINPIACGAGGTAAPLKIGNNTYMTHRYGTKCWMVENSREGTSNAVNFGGSISGTTWNNGSTYSPGTNNGQYYYGDSNRNTACPTGWHVPTATEAANLVSAVTTDISQNNGTKGAQWWAGASVLGLNSNSATAALTGGALYYNSGGISYRWNFWSQRGYWWIDGGTNLIGTSSNLSTQSGNSSMAFFPVRCVQN